MKENMSFTIMIETLLLKLPLVSSLPSLTTPILFSTALYHHPCPVIRLVR